MKSLPLLMLLILVAKANLWQARDLAIANKLEKLNNTTLPKEAYDQQAKFGAIKSTKNKQYPSLKNHTLHLKSPFF
jgi:hypothetical protein